MMMSMFFESCQQSIGIYSADAEVMARLPPYLPPDMRPCSEAQATRHYWIERLPSGECRVSCGRRLVGVARDAEGACEGLEGEINLYLAEHCADRVFVHAGVVGWEGRAIVIPGRSFSGKSSLVEALVRAGAAYASDEYAPLDLDGRVHPYPRAIKLRRTHRPYAERVDPHALGDCVREPMPVSLVLVTRYQPAARWNPRQATWGEGMLAMLANTVPARRRPQMVLPCLKAALAGARILEGSRGEADDVAPWVLECAREAA